MSEITEQSQSRRQEPRKSRQQLSSTQVMFAVILAIALMLAVQFSARISSERGLSQIRDTVQSEIEFLRNEQASLIDELDFVQSDAYVEQWARAEGRMVRDDMVLVIPREVSVQPAEAQVTQPIASLPDTLELETTLPDPEPWQLWWVLFFNAPPPEF